jgi:hypothetical protein
MIHRSYPEINGVIVTRYIPSPFEIGTVVPCVCRKGSWFTTFPTSASLPCLSTRVAHSVVWHIYSVALCRCCCVSVCAYKMQELLQIALLCWLFTSSRPCCGSTGFFQERSLFVLLRCTSVSLCDCHCFEPVLMAARGSVGSCLVYLLIRLVTQVTFDTQFQYIIDILQYNL